MPAHSPLLLPPYPTTLGVVLGGLDKKYIKETTVRIVLKGGQGTEQELATGTDMAEVREVNGQAISPLSDTP